MTTNRPGTQHGTSTGTTPGPNRHRSTIATAEVNARRLVASWYAEPEPDGESLLEPMEMNEGVLDDDIPDGMLDDRDDDLPEFPREPDPEHRSTRRTPAPHIVFWQASGTLKWGIPPIPASMAIDPLLLHGAVAHARRLELLAAALASLQKRALLASSLGEAVRLLRPLSKKRLAAEAGVEARTGSKISRDRFMVIESPLFGLVPLDFFTWAGANPWAPRVDAVRSADEMLRDDPLVSANALGSNVAAEHAVSADWVRKLAPSLRAVRERPDVIAIHQRAFPLTSWQDLRDDLGRAGDDRAKPVMCLALANVIGPSPTIGDMR